MPRTPALILLAALAVAIFCSETVSYILLPVVACLVAAGLCLIFWSNSKGEISAVITLVVMTFFCAAWAGYSLSRSPAENARVAEAKGIISDVRSWGRLQAVTLRVKNDSFILKRPWGEKYTIGKGLRISGWVKKFSSKFSENSQFREDFFWQARGVRAEIVATKVSHILGEEKFSLSLWRGKLHAYFETLPATLGAYLDAMWTGMRDGTLQKSHSRWGTVHLLAISGFHVGLVVWLGGAALFFVKSRRLGAIFISLILWLYILIAGAPPSAMRAALMFQVGLICGLIGRPAVGLNCVAVAAAALLTHSPFLFWDMGFRLSVVAALTITAIAQFAAHMVGDESHPWLLTPNAAIHGRSMLRSKQRNRFIYLAIPPAVYVTTYPIIAPIFDSVPLAGLFINFFAVPFFAFAFPFASLAALLGIFVYPADFILRAFGRIADIVVSIVPFHVKWNSFLAAICIIFFAAIVFRALLDERKT